MDRRKFVRVAGGGFVFAAATAALAGCSQQMPAAAIEPWQGPGPEADPRRWILGDAILAPHSHNLQSWLVDLRTPDEIVLRCDLGRLLPETDPFSRQIMMSHGTFLELLDIAARERGLRADITLFPEGAFGSEKLDERPVARIRLMPDTATRKDPLFTQILARRTNRSLYDLRRPVCSGRSQSKVGPFHRVTVVLNVEGRAHEIRHGQGRRGASGVAWRLRVRERTRVEAV